MATNRPSGLMPMGVLPDPAPRLGEPRWRNGLRPELPPLPASMESLPRHRGYPVPWFVEWIDGQPEFRIADRRKRAQAVRERLCWVCGKKVAGPLAFVLGPMCAVNRTTAEPGCHIECAEWSAIACPFLSRPHMERREGGIAEEAVSPGGFAIKRNPGVALVWITKDFAILRGHNLLRIGAPTKVLAFAEGRPASKQEVARSIETGLPSLVELAEMEGTHAVAALERMTAAACRLLGIGSLALTGTPEGGTE